MHILHAGISASIPIQSCYFHQGQQVTHCKSILMLAIYPSVYYHLFGDDHLPDAHCISKQSRGQNSTRPTRLSLSANEGDLKTLLRSLIQERMRYATNGEGGLAGDKRGLRFRLWRKLKINSTLNLMDLLIQGKPESKITPPTRRSFHFQSPTVRDN
jgi:hypothetical protein